MGAFSRSKGARGERAIVNRLKELGVYAERRVRNYSGDHDVDYYPWGEDLGALVAECKTLKSDNGFRTLRQFLGENDTLFLTFNREQPIVVLPWRVFERFMK